MVQQRLDNNIQKGYITLLSVLVLGVIFVAVSVFLLDTGLFSSLNSFYQQQELKARSAANACAEAGLQEIRDSVPFTGNGSLILADSSCSYLVTSLGGQDREVYAVGISGESTMRIKILIDAINPSINVVSWQEGADF